MSDSIRKRVTEDFKQANVKGGSRLARIRDILKDAASQTVAEVRRGSDELREIGTGTFSAATQNSAGFDAQEPNKSENLSLRQAFQNMSVAVREKFFARFKHQAEKLDGKLTERYGPQYQAAKGHLENASERYRQAVETAQASGSDPLQQQQEKLNETAGVAGGSVAQKEHQLKQRLREILRAQTTKTNKP
ncbi:hypothetical protein [Altericista sp. CCNU0014]|uniref:hypothetical protein n=1 Tax=Altericista sp. CCNU0014 TaxID=3082949 RepID=UPI00384C6013